MVSEVVKGERDETAELNAALKEWGLWKASADSCRELGFKLPTYGPGPAKGMKPAFYLPRVELAALSHAVAGLKRHKPVAGVLIDNKYIHRMRDADNWKRMGLKRDSFKQDLRYAHGYIQGQRPMYVGAAMDMSEQDLTQALGEA